MRTRGDESDYIQPVMLADPLKNDHPAGDYLYEAGWKKSNLWGYTQYLVDTTGYNFS